MDQPSLFQAKTVLITGGTGTFGRAFAKSLLQKDEVSKVIVFSRDEWKQWEMRESDPIFRHSKIRYFIGDVRDKERLKQAFNEVNIIVHAAALKQVPAAEYNPTEFIKTNILGASNLISAAIDSGVERVIALSSDKAVNPINLYGATKLCSDKLFIAAKSYVGKRPGPLFAIVRYGNVIGSRGSLLPHWNKIIATGATALPITDNRMTRFWITIQNAVAMVTKAASLMKGSEIFVPKCPSIKIETLAKAFAPYLGQKITGIRPGEKLHELLISSDDSSHTYEFDDHFRIVPSDAPVPIGGKKMEDGFFLSSDKNPLFITDIAAINNLLREAQCQ
jgi:UDP-N-acetylglucosamine 4,6-dehydratase/5-epimerase